MEENKNTKFYLGNPNIGEPTYLGEGSATVTQDGEKWEIKAEITTTKTEGVLMLLQFVADTGQGEHSEQAKRALNVINKNLAHFQIIAKDEPGEGVNFFWNVKAGVRETAADKEVKEVLSLPIVKAAILKVFPDAGKAPGGEIRKDGGPLKMSPYMAKMRIPEREAGTTRATYKKPTIELTPAQSKFERAILRLLRDNSILDKNHPAYLLGNGGEGVRQAEVWDNKTGMVSVESIPYASIIVNWAELYKAYADRPAAEISGKERQTIRAILESMKRELGVSVWQREVNKEGERKVQRFKIESPLIMQASAAELTPEEAEEVEAGGNLPEDKERLLLLLHPAYTHDIKEKTHTLPADYDRRISIVLGKGGKMKTSNERLLNYLNTIRCGGARDTLADLETMVSIMGLERIRTKQGLPKVRAEITEGLNLAKGINLVLSFTDAPGAKGQEQYQIIFNPDFVKQ